MYVEYHIWTYNSKSGYEKRNKVFFPLNICADWCNLSVIYFWLRFVLTNAINDYQRKIICNVCVGNFQPLMLLILSHQIWVGFIFVYQKSLKRTFQTGLWVLIHLLNLCSSALDSQRLLCSQKVVVNCWN